MVVDELMSVVSNCHTDTFKDDFDYEKWGHQMRCAKKPKGAWKRMKEVG